MKNYLNFIPNIARLFAFMVLLISSTASASHWVSTPSIVSFGDDIIINGGGAPGSSNITLQATNTDGDVLLNIEVFSLSDGSFSYDASLDASGELLFTATVNDESATSVSVIDNNE